LADRVFVAEEFFAHGGADDGDGGTDAGVALVEEAAVGEGPLVDREVVDGGAGDGGGAGVLARDGGVAAVADGGEGGDAVDLLGEGGDIGEGEVGHAGGGGARAEAHARAEHKEVAAEVGNLRAHRLGRALAERDHGDDGGDADDDAEHGEEGAHDVAADLAQGDLEGVEEDHGEGAEQVGSPMLRIKNIGP